METVKGPDSSPESLLTRLIDQYQAVLLQMCFMYLHDRMMAEDAVQDTFLKAYRAMDAFRGDCSEKTWLPKIAINTCRDMKRSAWFRHMDRRVTPEDVTSIHVQPVEDYDAEELAQAIGWTSMCFPAETEEPSSWMTAVGASPIRCHLLRIRSFLKRSACLLSERMGRC